MGNAFMSSNRARAGVTGALDSLSKDGYVEKFEAELKKSLIQIAKKEGRSLAQLCEILLRGAAASYKEDGPAYLQHLLSRQKKEPSE
jgi:hypothetical protein